MEQQSMMQNGLPPHMQRPQAGNLNQQLYAKVLTDLRQDMSRFAGSWQATFDPRMRANLIMQMITALRMLERDINKCVQTAQRFEVTSITAAQNQRQYEQSMQDKLEAIKLKRQQSIQMGQAAGFGANNAGAMAMQSGMGLGMPMQNQVFQNVAPNPQFPAHLQRPMQASPMPQQHQNTTMDPSLLANTPQLTHNFTPQPDMNIQQQLQQQQGELPIELQVMAQRMMAAIPEAKKHELRTSLLTQMSDQQRQSVAQRQIDPLRNWVISRARQEYLKLKQNGMPNAQPQQQNPFQLQNQNMQTSLSSNGQSVNDQAFLGGLNGQLGNIQQSSNDFNLSQLYGQQQSALKLQESGEQVVPISNNNNPGLQYMNMIKNMGTPNAPAMLPQLSNGSINQLNAAGNQRQALLQQQYVQQQQKRAQEQIIAQKNMQANVRNMNQRPAAQNPNLNVPNAFNGAPAGSPAMSMLNRPVQPPGKQNTPVSNQQQQPQKQNMLGVNPAAMHQAMNVNPVNAAAEPARGPPQPISALLSTLDPTLRNKILAMNPNERNRALLQLKQMHDRKQQSIQQVNQDFSNNLPGAMTQQVNNTAQQPSQADKAQQMQQRQKQQLRIHAMLSRPLPPNISSQLGIGIPPGVQFWHQLRAQIQANKDHFPKDMPQLLMQTMERHFLNNPGELQQAIQDIIARQQQQAFQQQGQPQNAQQNAIARAQAVNNAGQAAAGPPVQALQQPGGIAPASAQEIARFRIAHKVDNKVPDENIRNALMAQKLKDLRNRQAQAHAQAQAQAQAQAAIPVNKPAMPQPAQPKPVQPPRRQAQKTVNSDDVQEISNPNLSAPAMQTAKDAQLKLQQQMAAFGQNQAINRQVPTAKQPDKMQMQQEAKALVSRLYQELGVAPPKGGPVKVQPDEIAEIRRQFQRMWKPVQLLDSTIATALRFIPGFTEQNAKDVLRAKQLLMQNMADEQGNIRDHLSRSAHEIKAISDSILRYYGNLQAATKMGADKPGQPPVPSPPSAANTRAQPVPRKQSGSVRPPAAPTDDKKFWAAGVSSPQGVPKYESSRPELTADQLKFPPQKKRKVNGQVAGQPTSQPGTPAQPDVPKAVTPVIPAKPVSAAPKPAMEKARLRCTKSEMCEYSIIGFETEAQLKQHVETEHKPIDDPLQYLIDTTTAFATAKPIELRKPARLTASKAEVKENELTMEDAMLEKFGYGDLVAKKAPSHQSATDTAPSQGLFNEVGDVIMAGLVDLDPFDFSSGSNDLPWEFRDDDELDALDNSSPELTPDSQGTKSTSDISLHDRIKMNLEWDAFGDGGFYATDSIDLDVLELGADTSNDTKMVDSDGLDNCHSEAWDWEGDLLSWDFAKPVKTTN